MGLRHWNVTGDQPDDYVLEMDEETLDGKPVAVLRSVVTPARAFGASAQAILAAEYAGARVRLSAMLRATDVTGWAGLWMRIDGPRPGETLALDNMQDRALTGTTEWERHAVVLDVPSDATMIVFGALLAEEGQLRMADFRFEQVGTDVPVTGQGFAVTAHPRNLDFAEV